MIKTKAEMDCYGVVVALFKIAKEHPNNPYLLEIVKCIDACKNEKQIRRFLSTRKIKTLFCKYLATRDLYN